MKILCLVLPAALLAAAAPALSAAPPAQPAAADKGFGEQVDVNVVNVEVYVTDANGRRVDGLQRGDFTLLEDGKPMQIVNFDAVDRTAAAQAPAPVAAPAAEGSAPAASAVQQAPAADPLHLVVYVDNTHLAPGHRKRVLEQLRGFLTQRLNPGDAVMLATYDPGLHVRLPFTADRAALSKALDAVEKAAGDGGGDSRARRAALQHVVEIQERTLMAQKKQDEKADKISRRGDPDAGDPAGPESDTPCPPEIAEPVKSYAEQSRQEVLRSITGLTVLVNSLSGLPGRKAMLHVSDGLSVTPGEELFQALYEMCGGGAATTGPNGATLSVDAQTLSVRTYRGNQAMLDAQAYSTVKQWNTLAAHASAQRVTLYTLQASGLAGGASEAADMGPGDRLLQTGSVAQIERENLRSSLTALASGTGGRAVFDANDLQRDIAHIEDDLGHYYSLGYTPTHNGDGHDHNIVVKVQGNGYHARYRQVYRDKPPLEKVVDRTLAALFLGTGDNPLAVTLEVGDIVPGTAGAQVPIRLLIPLNNVGLSMRGDGYDGKLRVFLVTSTTGGGNSAVRQIEVPLRIPMQNSQATMMQSYLYEVKLQLPPGEHRVAVGIRDDITNMASFLSKAVRVGGGSAAK